MILCLPPWSLHPAPVALPPGRRLGPAPLGQHIYFSIFLHIMTWSVMKCQGEEERVDQD